MRRSARGFTLIELMVVVAILAIMVSLAITAYQGIGSRSEPQNAAHQFYSTLTKARALAVDRNCDVWVVIYPVGNRAGATGGSGAYFVHQDADGDIAGQFAGSTPGSLPHLQDETFMEDYRRGNAAFGVGTTTYGSPFTPLNAPQTCSFCSDDRGAIVFTGEGTAYFRDGDGVPVAARLGGVGIKGVETTQSYLFGISSATSIVASFP